MPGARKMNMPNTGLPKDDGDSHLAGVPASDIAKIWPVILPFVVDAMSWTPAIRHTPEHIFGGLLTKKYQLWVSVRSRRIEGVLITEVVDYPRCKVCRYVILSGRNASQNWVKFEPIIAAWAKAQGCSKMEGVGRKGWGRTNITPEGWKQIAVLIEKDI